MLVIESKKQYEVAMTRIESLMNIGKLTDERKSELESLVSMVQDYEDSVFSIDSPHPVDAIKFRMDQLGLTGDDLVPVIGDASMVKRFLEKELVLSDVMVVAVKKHLGIELNS